jgi:hypothetical protein
MRKRAASINPIIRKPNNLRFLVLAELNPTPTSDRPAMGNQVAKRNFDGCASAAVGPVVVMVRVEVTPAVVGVTGLVAKLEAPHAGNGDPEPATVQERLTGEV